MWQSSKCNQHNPEQLEHSGMKESHRTDGWNNRTLTTYDTLALDFFCDFKRCQFPVFQREYSKWFYQDESGQSYNMTPVSTMPLYRHTCCFDLHLYLCQKKERKCWGDMFHFSVFDRFSRQPSLDQSFESKAVRSQNTSDGSFYSFILL